jgi:peptidyl-prolyl cis-trans isomerase C
VRLNISVCKYIVCTVIAVGLLIGANTRAISAGEDKVLAEIAGNKVTEADLKEISDAVPQRFRHLYLTPEGRKKTLDYIVNIYVLAAQAKKEGLPKDPRVQRLQRFTQNDLLARLYLEKKNKDLKAPADADAKAYYNKNISQYTTPESVHLYHILVKTEKEARNALAQLKKGAKFSDLASKISICPSRYKGGDLSWLPKGSLVKEIEDVAFAMKPGEEPASLKGPVKSKFGYHILMLQDKRPSVKRPFDEVKPYIVETLKFERQQKNYEKIAADLKKKMNVKINVPSAPEAKPAGPAAGPKKK